MAYKTAITTLCREDYCNVSAKWEVFNRRNASMGRYCTRHANARLREIQTIEEKEDRERNVQS